MLKGQQYMKMRLERSKYMWIAFLVSLLPRLLFLIKTYPVSIGGDEMFAMWPAAKLLGYDWSGVMQGYRYYGYGYTILLIPFMALIKNPLILYRCMAAMMALCQALSAPISFHLMKKYFHMTDEKETCLISIACSYLVAVRATYTYPEFVYVLMVWLIIWALLKLDSVNEKRKEKVIYSIMLFMLMTYVYMVHSRALALWMALAGVMVLYGWIYRKACLSLPVCIICGFPLFFAAKSGINKWLEYLNGVQMQQVSNTNAMVSIDILKQFKNPKSWTAWADIIIGQLNESVVLTGGIAVAVVIGMLLLIKKAIKRDSDVIGSEQKTYAPYIVTGVFCMCAIGITIGGQSLSWLGGVTAAMEGTGNEDSFRAITYLRYYGAYIGPLFMAGTVYIIKNRKIIEEIKGKVLIVTGLLQGYWVLVILPVLCYALGCVWSYAPFSLTKGFAADSVGIRSYLPGTVFVIVFMIISYRLFSKKRVKILLSIFCMVLIYTYAFNGIYHERYRGEKNYQYTKPVVEWIEALEKSGEELEEIYVDDSRVPGTWQETRCQYQFLMPEKRVICEVPEGKGETIYICHHPEEMEQELKGSYEKIQISESAYVYVWGEKLQKAVNRI